MFKLESTKEKITAARIKLLIKQPFFGSLATRLGVHEVTWCNTLCTDGRNIYYNDKFLSNMSFEQIEFCVAHEILHLVYDHCGRLGHRHPRIHNMAADFCVNGLLIRDGIGSVPDINLCHNPEYYGKPSEEIYDILMSNVNTIDLDQLGQLLDEHIDWSTPDPNDPSRPVYSKQEINDIKQVVKEAIIAAAQAAGNLPNEIAKLVKSLTTPQIDWRDVLRAQIQSIIKNDYTWERFNKKMAYTGIYLPAVKPDTTIDICIALDFSGSCYEAIKDFLSEVKGIMDQFIDFKIKMFTFDTQVYNEKDFDIDNADQLLEYEVKGGGGTDFECVWDYMKDNDINPKKLIMFTDMYPCGSWGDDSYCDTIFIAHNTDIEAPFGVTVKYTKGE